MADPKLELKQKIENVLGTTKRPTESWGEIFERLQIEGRIDMKVVCALLAVILDDYAS